MNFKEWFATRLIITSYPTPKQVEDRYRDVDIFINVSDEYQPLHHHSLCAFSKQSHWFPLGECGDSMGLTSIFGALQVLWHCWKGNRSVVLHCHAGINRSQTVGAAFYFLVTGEHLEDRKTASGLFTTTNMLLVNCGTHLPELALFEKWMHQCQIAFTEPDKYIGGMYDWTLRTAGIK